MRVKVGEKYYFWNVNRNHIARLTVLSCSSGGFTFSCGKIRGKSTYAEADGVLFKEKDDVPQFSARYSDDGTFEDVVDAPAFDNFVGFAHADFSGTGYKYYPPIFRYNGADDRLTGGNVYDLEESNDSCD